MTRFKFLPGGFAPPDPLAPSLAGTPVPRSAPVARSLRSLATRVFVHATVLAVCGLGAAIAAARAEQAGQQPPSAAAIQVDHVKDNLYVLRGGGGNTAAFVTAAGVVLVDTKVPGWGAAILDKLKEITDKPVTTIINTHTHFDHVGSNPEFPATVEVIAHENTATLMREMRPVTGGPDQPKVFKESEGRGLPKRSFRERLTLGSGRDQIDLHYFGRAHTGGDAWIVFPAVGAVHAGDVFPNKGIPLIDASNGGSGVEYPQTLAKAAAGLPGIDTVITGHFDTTLTMADLRLYEEFSREIVRAVQEAKKSGRTIDDVVSSWRVPERYLKAGYTQIGDDPRMAATRFRTNVVEVIWSETK
jgi:cyclase